MIADPEKVKAFDQAKPEKVNAFNPTNNTPKTLQVPRNLEEALTGLDAQQWFDAWQMMVKIEDRKTWELTTDDEIAIMIASEAKALKFKFTFR
jgi:hypothetical protein